MSSSYTKRIFVSFILVFTVFTTVVIMVQRNREKAYKEDNFKRYLEAFTHVIRNEIGVIDNPSILSFKHVGALDTLLPKTVRFTVIKKDGEVLYDSKVEESDKMENHLARPEIHQALVKGEGSKIRHSSTKGIDYFYYATYGDGYFVRVALPNDMQLQSVLEADDIVTYFILFLFFMAIITILYFSDRFSYALTSLNEFVKGVERNNPDYEKIKFPDTELGEIGSRIVTMYSEMEKQKQQIKIEKEKLLKHFHYSTEGVAIFEKSGKLLYANRFFIQSLNHLLDEPSLEIEKLFEFPIFHEFASFIVKEQSKDLISGKSPHLEQNIEHNGRYYRVGVVVFDDHSYEFTINDISISEQNAKLKQQMTHNIAHELRTPVSSISGYLETLLMQPTIDGERSRNFIEKAYAQSRRLTDLIRDISLITKMSEAPTLFEKTDVHLSNVFNDVIEELHREVEKQHIVVENRLEESLCVKGNEILLFSVFRNLVENSIKYGGENIKVGLELFAEDEQYFYINYYDTGIGVAPEYLDKIFDRFYRIKEGRSRKSGGSGLGLSIVRNAVVLHQGTIQAKPRKGGGITFLITLSKK